MIDFPNSPAVGDVFSAGAASWRWDGVKWMPAWSTPPIVSDRAIVVHGSHVIAAGEAGNVYVSGLTAPATIVLPPTPAAGDRVFVKDTDGGAASNTITVISANSTTIDDHPNFLLDYAYAQARFSWSGTEWSVG